MCRCRLVGLFVVFGLSVRGCRVQNIIVLWHGGSPRGRDETKTAAGDPSSSPRACSCWYWSVHWLWCAHRRLCSLPPSDREVVLHFQLRVCHRASEPLHEGLLDDHIVCKELSLRLKFIRWVSGVSAGNLGCHHLSRRCSLLKQLHRHHHRTCV